MDSQFFLPVLLTSCFKRIFDKHFILTYEIIRATDSTIKWGWNKRGYFDKIKRKELFVNETQF